MRTMKSYSTISYNSVEFLKIKLNDLINRNKIAFYAFIYHFAEDDEEKDHIHLYIEPNGTNDTDQVREYLEEIDLTRLDKKPLGCRPCKSSKWQDWYLYAIHDKEYLASKGQSRKYHYTKEDMIVSDKLYFTELLHSMDLTKLRPMKVLKEAVDNGQSFVSLVKNGTIPVQLINQYMRVWDLITGNETYRDNRESHTPIVDPDTGEIMNEDTQEE